MEYQGFRRPELRVWHTVDSTLSEPSAVRFASLTTEVGAMSPLP